MKLLARAKINWTLDITGVREDGYHLMDMLMQPVTLADEISLLPADTLSLEMAGTPRLPADESNLALRAARLLRETCGVREGAAIRVIKHIPAGAGMGGGSADAAAVLLGLNRLWNLGLSGERLEELGLRLGADVPFCVRGGLCRARGIGEQLTELPCGRSWWLCVVQPCRALSTGEVFRGWHAMGSVSRPDNETALQALADGDRAALAGACANVLEPVSLAARPEMAGCMEALTALGAAPARMTGSGSCVFGVFPEEEQARSAAGVMEERWPGQVWVCRTARRSVVFEEE